jgi:hypothetical protein
MGTRKEFFEILDNFGMHPQIGKPWILDGTAITGPVIVFAFVLTITPSRGDH